MLLEVVALRGYESDATKFDKALRGRVALVETAESMKERASRGGSGAGGTGLAAAMTAAGAWRSVLQHLTAVMTERFPGVLRGEDPEDLHAFRVSVRRIRTLLQDANDVVDPEVRDRFRCDFRWLGDITTPSRDADVHVLELPGLMSSIPAEIRSQGASLEAVLAEHRTACHAEMVVELRSMRRAEFGTAWASFLADDAAWVGTGELSDDPAIDVVLARIARAHRQLIKSGRRIRKDSPPIALHELRKEGKRLRYLLECFGQLLDADAAERALVPLRDLQDLLGEFQDSEVQAEALRSLVGESSPVLEAIVVQLRSRGESARREFSTRFGRFDDRKVERAFDRLRPKDRTDSKSSRRKRR